MSRGAVLITGGAGYIGSHVAIACIEAGYPVVVLDDLSTGHRALVPCSAAFFQGDAGNGELLAHIFREFSIEAVIHLAGSIFVGESVANPLKYYRNNTVVTQRLAETCVHHGVNRFVFSSSAAVYGNPDKVPVPEDAACRPINPYGASKLASEMILRDTAAATDMKCGILRYFNVAGADPKGCSGESTKGSTHLIKVACEVAVGKRPYLEIFGDDYETPDGTCMRDYIHVSDLADLHIAALGQLERGRDSLVMNCGYGQGLSVREIVSALEAENGEPLPVRIAARREGDPAVLVADVARLKTQIGWEPQHADLGAMLNSALFWEWTRQKPIGRDVEKVFARISP